MTTLAVVSGQNVPTLESFKQNVSTFSIGTRKSKLALAQTDLVVKALMTAWPDHKYDVKARDTAAGDIDKTTPFKDMPVKNIWTHELESLMLEGKLDLLVHSLKGKRPDVPTQLPDGCEIGAVLERVDPRDAFVLKTGRQAGSIQDLPAGSVIGTSSIRRTAQIAQRYPHLVVKDVRGNIGTRLSKLDAEDGPFDALILAAAGLLRLDLGHRISQYLDSENGKMMYAVGQGAIAIENRSNDPEVKEMLARITHKSTQIAITAERSLLKTLEGGCSAPLGVETRWLDAAHSNALLRMKATVVSTNGEEYVETEMTGEVKSLEDAELFGLNVASELLRRGADKILAEIKAKKPTTITDLGQN